MFFNLDSMILIAAVSQSNTRVSLMKFEQVITIQETGRQFQWIDVVDPSKLELEGLASQFVLPPHAIQDCLESAHLPKIERISGMNFIIVRAYDERAGRDADTPQELTRKIAIFESSELIITLRRQDQSYFADLKEEWKTRFTLGDPIDSSEILLDILGASIHSFASPMYMNRTLLEEFEERVFKHEGDTFEDGYYLKRRASTFKRMIRLSLDVHVKLAERCQTHQAKSQDIRENGESLLYQAEEFYENITNLVSLHLSLSSNRLTAASHHQNETMRILTIFSVFFMPLNLVTGIYGMNFEHMPELKWPWGYAFAISLLVFIALGIAYFFYYKGYFKRNRAD